MTAANSEIYRLIELMPASGRMYVKLRSQPQQSVVIQTAVPRPFDATRYIDINFERWKQLPQPQRDLLLLRSVSWAIDFKWIKPQFYESLVALGLTGMAFEGLILNAAGLLTATAVTMAAATQVWRKSRRVEAEIEADAQGIQTAQRRGYSKTAAAQALLEAIESLPALEGRAGLTVAEVVRCQALKPIAGLSPLDVA